MIRQILSWTLWPLFVAVNILVLVVLAQSATPREQLILSGPILIVVSLVLLAFERLLPYRNEWSVRGDRDVWRDIGHTIVFGAIGQRLGALLAVMVMVLFINGSWLEVLDRPRGIWPGTSPLLVQILLVVVLGDFLEYWLHRLTHTSRFWPLHALHHTPDRLHVFKTGRHTVAYALGRGMLVWLPLLAIGVPLSLLIWHPLSLGIFGNLGHANIDFRVPGFVHRLFMTPQFHRIHHSVDAVHGNSNLCVCFTLWDILFGTFVDPRTVAVDKVGIKNDPIPRKFLQEVFSPLIWRRLVRNQPSRGGGEHTV